MSATAARSTGKKRDEHTHPPPVKYCKVTQDRSPHRDFQKDWRRDTVNKKDAFPG